MKIAVIVPSYNEADNITFVVQMIDRGLKLAIKKFPRISEAIIVNVDNSSKDGTSAVFQKTKTDFLKLALKTKGRPGKGKNLIYFLKDNYKKYDIFITLDSDLKSIKEDWIHKLLVPFFNKNKDCDFVWPLYKRSRFEGSTTNHFAYPIIYAFFKLDVRQPIAGDFAFSKRLASKIINSSIPDAAYYYGIDILFSIRAAQYARYSEQVNLDYKIHKPSFSKLEKMFPQVASSAIDVLRSQKKFTVSGKMKNNQSTCISADKTFRHHDQAHELYLKKVEYLHKNLELVQWLSVKSRGYVNAALSNKKDFNANLWTLVLSDWLTYALRNFKKGSLELAEELLPFFVLRAVNFWNSTVNLSGLSVEKIIKNQAHLFEEKIKK